MKIFPDAYLKKYKIAGIIIYGILFLWFSFVLTGLRFGDIILVKSCFVDEPIDVLFWGVYAGCFIFFILKDKIGKYVITGYTLFWGLMQLSNYFRSADGIKSYNEAFSDTHHMFQMSEMYIVKDTYHILLDIFILTAVCFGVFYIVLTIRKKQSSNAP